MKKLFILGLATVAVSSLNAEPYHGGYSTYNQPSYHSGYYNQPGYQGNYYQPGHEVYNQPNYNQGNYYQPGYQGNYYQPADQGYYPQQGCSSGQYSAGAYQGNQTGYGHEGYNYMEDMNHPKFRNEEDRAMYKSVIDSVRSRYPNVSVFVDNGNVTLQGSVRSQDEKRSLEDRIKNMSGVRNLNSQLRVEGEQGGMMRPTDRNQRGMFGTSPQPNYNEGSNANYSKDNQNRYNDNQGKYQSEYNQNDNNGNRSDSDISKKIRSELSSYNNVNASVNNGVVTLSGSVDSQNDLEKVERKVRSIRGVRNVNNQLSVSSSSRNY